MLVFSSPFLNHKPFTVQYVYPQERHPPGPDSCSTHMRNVVLRSDTSCKGVPTLPSLERET